LAHENINTTAIYTQPSARDLERAVERLEWDHLAPAPPSGHPSNEARTRRR
jgi:hypothetical protein